MANSVPNPRLLIRGVALDTTTEVAALANVSIVWGTDAITEDPKPATLTVTLRYAGATDVLRVRQGDLIELTQVHPDQGRTAFSGRVRNMDAEHDDQGKLRLTITATDHLADLENTFLSTAWHSDDVAQAEGSTVRQRLVEALAAKGWSVTGLETLPAELGPSAATFYNSIKATTLLRRYLAQHGPQALYWDSSYTSSTTGQLVRRLSIGHMADTAGGDVLTANSAGGWYRLYRTPAPLRAVQVPAANVLRDISWESTPDNLVTTARVSYQRTRKEERDDGTTAWVTSLDDTDVSRGQTWEDQYGTRAIELETCTFSRRTDGSYDPAIYRTIGQKWMQYNGDEWRPGALRIVNSMDLPAQLLSDLVGKETRPRQWLVITGVQVQTPRGARADVRGLATGGRLDWNHEGQRWDITLSLTDTTVVGTTLWRFTDLAAHTNPLLAQAPANQAGNVAFSAFDTITTLR